jgi:hypothetical protein
VPQPICPACLDRTKSYLDSLTPMRFAPWPDQN